MFSELQEKKDNESIVKKVGTESEFQTSHLQNFLTLRKYIQKKVDNDLNTTNKNSTMNNESDNLDESSKKNEDPSDESHDNKPFNKKSQKSFQSGGLMHNNLKNNPKNKTGGFARGTQGFGIVANRNIKSNIVCKSGNFIKKGNTPTGQRKPEHTVANDNGQTSGKSNGGERVNSCNNMISPVKIPPPNQPPNSGGAIINRPGTQQSGRRYMGNANLPAGRAQPKIWNRYNNNNNATNKLGDNTSTSNTNNTQLPGPAGQTKPVIGGTTGNNPPKVIKFNNKNVNNYTNQRVNNNINTANGNNRPTTNPNQSQNKAMAGNRAQNPIGTVNNAKTEKAIKEVPKVQKEKSETLEEKKNNFLSNSKLDEPLTETPRQEEDKPEPQAKEDSAMEIQQENIYSKKETADLRISDISPSDMDLNKIDSDDVLLKYKANSENIDEDLGSNDKDNGDLEKSRSEKVTSRRNSKAEFFGNSDEKPKENKIEKEQEKNEEIENDVKDSGFEDDFDGEGERGSDMVVNEVNESQEDTIYSGFKEKDDGDKDSF